MFSFSYWALLKPLVPKRSYTCLKKYHDHLFINTISTYLMFQPNIITDFMLPFICAPIFCILGYCVL